MSQYKNLVHNLISSWLFEAAYVISNCSTQPFLLFHLSFTIMYHIHEVMLYIHAWGSECGRIKMIWRAFATPSHNDRKTTIFSKVISSLLASHILVIMSLSFQIGTHNPYSSMKFTCSHQIKLKYTSDCSWLELQPEISSTLAGFIPRRRNRVKF